MLRWLFTPWILLVAANLAFALDAKQVFERVAPATVLISDVDSHGSGVVVSDQGLILTNYHVVAANIDLKIKVQLRSREGVVEKEIDDVKVLKIHPFYDIALLEAKPPAGTTFMVAPIIPKTIPIATGSKCFAIGNPGGPDGGALELSITEGVISANSRQVDGLTYLQISAAINPGNSGGPICNEQGQVIGLATWKMTNAEALGFAIPTQKVALADFIPVAQRKPDFELAHKAEELASRYYEAAQEASGAERRGLLLRAAYCYRISMLAVPTSAVPYNNVSIMFHELGERKLRVKYLEAALRVAPDHPNTCHMLGISHFEGHENDRATVECCRELWERGLASKGSPGERALCADDLAVLHVKAGSFAAAAYVLQWSEILLEEAGERQNPARANAWDQLKAALPADQLEAVRGRRSGFSMDEYRAVVAGKRIASQPAAAPTPADGQATAGSGRGVEPGQFSPAQVEAVRKSAEARFGKEVIAIPPEGLELPLPDEPGAAILASNGWQVVIAFPALAKLGVFNLASGKCDGFIDCEEEKPLLASGGFVLAVYQHGSKTVELHDLSKMQKISTRRDVLPGTIVVLGMGAANPSTIIAVQQVANSQGTEELHAVTLSVPDLRVQRIPVEIEAATFRREQMRGVVDDAGSMAAFFGGDGSLGFGFLNLRALGKSKYRRASDSRDFLGFTVPDGYLVGRWGVFEPDGIKQRFPDHSNRGPSWLTPILGFAGFLESTEYGGPRGFSGFRVRSLPGANVVLEIPREGRKDRRFDQYSQDRLFATIGPDRIVEIFAKKKVMQLSLLGLKGGNSGLAVATKGTRWEKKLDVASGSTVVVQSAPEGLTYDAAQMTLMWNVPASAKSGQAVTVIVLVTTPAGQKEYKTEKIMVQ